MTVLKRILAAIGYSLLFAAFILITAATRHGRDLDLSHWPDALLWGGVALAIGVAALVLVMLPLFAAQAMSTRSRRSKKPETAQLANVKRLGWTIVALGFTMAAAGFGTWLSLPADSQEPLAREVAMVVLVVGALLLLFGIALLAQRPPATRAVSAARMAAAQRESLAIDSADLETRTAQLPRGRMSVVPGSDPLMPALVPATVDLRVGVRRLAWRHVGLTMLIVGGLGAIPAATGVLLGTLGSYPAALAAIPFAYLAYGFALVLATRGPKAQVDEASPMVQFLFLWTMKRYGWPLLFLVAMLPYLVMGIWLGAHR